MEAFRRRVQTRIAWLGITQRTLCEAISMDPAVLSRALKADHPRKGTLVKIGKGLALTIDELLSEDESVLVRPHPAFEGLEEGVDRRPALIRWCGEEG